MRQKIKLVAILWLSCASFVMGQLASYQYQRELTGINETWHGISLPMEVLSKAKTDLSDLRVYGIKSEGDTIEAPYLLSMLGDKQVNKQVAFSIINSASVDGGYYYTFEVQEETFLNTLDLTFERQNFDWKVQLEGSQNQNEWFTLLETYRLVSIKNEDTSFSFTRLSIPTSKYRYYRLYVPSEKDPELSKVSITQREQQVGSYHALKFIKRSQREIPEDNRTIVDLRLADRVHLSELMVSVADTIDYYRAIEIKALKDSFETEKGWRYSYQTIGTGTLSSVQPNVFSLGNVAAKQLQIVIKNQDNQPLEIGEITAKGSRYELIVRITEEATYYLAYGNPRAVRPQYDIERFKEKIPSKVPQLALGTEIIYLDESTQSNALFENKGWLWGLTVLIILILGWFSIQMMRNTEKS